MVPVRTRSLPYTVTMLALGGLLASALPSSAQGFGVGARFAWVKSDLDVDVDSVRFIGGQVRLLSQRAGLEVSLDHHSESSELLGQKITATPIQVSVLVRLTSSKISPFLLGGPGWYRQKVEPLNGPGDLAVSTTEFGWHAGIGLELLPSRHVGIHGDYRYTFLNFNGDDERDQGFIDRLIPGHRGSMWTLGATVYF
jgi:opacity protein-like surface antigen